MSKAARWFAAVLVILALAGGTLAIVGCGDKGTSPKITGTLPYSLDGVWQVADVTASLGQPGGGELVNVYNDTICVEEPDFGIASADETWKMFIMYHGILPGKWTDPEWDSWSVTLDSTVTGFFAGHASATLEQCDFKVRVYIAGGFDGNVWKLKRTIERVEGRQCGHHGDDTTLYRYQYISTLERVGDAPEDCSDNLFGP